MKLIIRNIIFYSLLFFLNAGGIAAQDFFDVKIGLIHPQKTIEFLHKSDPNYLPIHDWEILFLSSKIPYKVFYDEDLDDNNFEDMDVLILPSVEILSDDAIENLSDFLMNGKGLFVLGELGSYNTNGLLRSNSALNELVGIRPQKININNDGVVTQSIVKTDPLTHHLSANSNLMLLHQNSLFIADTKSKGLINLSYYDEKSVGSKTGIFRSKNENNRVIWFGFQLNQIAGGISKFEMQKLILNSVKFLADKPMIWMNRWPENYKHCYLFTVSGNSSKSFFKNHINLISDKFEMNYFLTPDEIQNFRTELSNISTYSSLNVFFDNSEYLTLSETEKMSLLDESYVNLRSFNTIRTPGILLLNDYDWIKRMDSLRKFGYRFLVYDYKIYDLNPLRGADKTIEDVIIPNHTKIDLNNEYERLSFQNEKDVNEITLVELVIPEGDPGTNLIDYNIRKISNNFVSDNNWVTTFDELLKWLELKEKIDYELSAESGQSFLLVNVHNNNSSSLGNIVFHLSLPTYIHPTSMLNSNASIKLNYSTGYYDLKINSLRANQKLQFKINYLEKN